MFSSVLIANRGEIAVRIARTLRRMGIRSVVAASIPDRRSLAVRTADASVLLEGYSAAETYLDIEAIIAAAKAEGCDAIHPGYGFLSENAAFAERCAAEGITFIGPPPAVLRGMGDKAAARQLAVANGVPVVPGFDGADDDETLAREAARIGYPVMVKARGGGGGRGMREVHAAADLAEALASARREALSAFGDGGLLLEKLVRNAHHVEVQILADAHGHAVHLGERDCSVQRRRQKLIEETPSPVVDAALREALTGAALRLARAVGYVNAGTFEFLVGEPAAGGARPFDVLEVNPRLQVEHPVTELVTGLDLVELQVRIAAGEPLPFEQGDVTFSGHAIEFRINAEDPWDAFKPGTGRITALSLGTGDARVDAGFDSGDVVPAQYDSLLAKVIHTGASREEALAAAQSLHADRVIGPPTNTALHVAILRHPAFAAGEASISWLETHLDELLSNGVAPDELWAAAAAALHIRSGVFSRLGASEVHLSDGAVSRVVRIQAVADQLEVQQGNRAIRLAVAHQSRGAVEFAWRGTPLRTLRSSNSLRTPKVMHAWRTDPEAAAAFEVVPPPPLPRRAQATAGGGSAVVAPLAGTIAEVRVAEGDTVEAGQLLLTLEAMKMEHRITASSAGTVRRVAIQPRDVVREGDVLIELG